MMIGTPVETMAGRHAAAGEGHVVATRPVLVVDDDEGIREFVSVALHEEGYRVLLAPDGLAALRLLHDDPPGLILLDLWMPELDGHGFLAAYRHLPAPRAPVVIFTASEAEPAADVPPDVAGYLPKPVELLELLDAVARYAPTD
jgi:CheY-like chemotaxis protein